jgi:hypothetical protein
MSVRDPSPLIMKVIDSLQSLQDLQVLLALMDTPERWWDADTLADDIGVARSVTRLGLDRLAARNFLDIRVSNEIRFRYNPGTSDLEEAGMAFHDAYRKNPIAIARLVAVHRPRTIKDFADAFRIRHDDDR